MRARNVLAFVVSFLVAGAVLAQGSGETKAKAAPKAAPKAAHSKAVIWPAADIKWTAMTPGPPGVTVADLWGDHTKSAFGALIKFPAGTVAGLHTHTNNMRIVVVSGTFIHGPEGKPEVRLGPGSYLMQAGGNYRHTTACDKASECLFFVESNGKFDLTMADAGAKEAPKK